jgi:hypothetical protein
VTVSGVATAANQATEITSLQLIDDLVHATNGALNKAAAIAGQLDDTSTTAATEDNVAPVRITAQRALHTNLRNTAGTEVGTSGAPLRTDPTGTTAQPVSQSTAAALSGAWPVKVTDGTNNAPTMDVAARAGFQKITDGTNTAAVKAGSTAPVAADPAVVVAISPNTPALPVTGPLTDTQLRATAVPVTGPLTDTQLRATAVPVSGPLTDAQLRATAVPVTASQGTAAAVASAWPTKVTDGTSTAAVKAASTAPVAADPALVVTISPNSPGTIITGGVANGATANPNPVTMSGRDTDGVIHTLAVSSQGRLLLESDDPTFRTIAVDYSASTAVAGAQAGLFFKAATYTVPTSYKFRPAVFRCASDDNRVTGRVAKVKVLGAFNSGTNVYTASGTYTVPEFSQLEVEITTATGNADDTLTITYTNQSGTTGQTTTVLIGKNTPAGYKFPVSLAAGDIGVIAVTNVTRSVNIAGVMNLNGVVALAVDRVLTATDVVNVSIPSVLVVRAGESLHLDYASNAAGTSLRSLNVVGSLEPA